jgi:hypothetical protein
MAHIRHQAFQDIARSLEVQDELTRVAQDLACLHRAQDLSIKSTLAFDQELANLRAPLLAIENLVTSSLKETFGPAGDLARIQDHLLSIFDTSRLVGESLRVAQGLRGIEEIRRWTTSIDEAFQKSFASTLAIQESFTRGLTVSLDIQKELSQLLPHSLGQELNRLAQVATSLPISEIHLSSEGVLRIGDESLPVETIREYIEETLSGQHLPSIQEFLSQLLAKAKNLPSRASVLFVFCVQHLLLPVVIGVAVNLYTPDIQTYLIEHGHLSKREAAKVITENVTRQVPAEVLQDLRFVRASKLQVRDSPSKDSPRVGVVYFSEVLKVVKEKKDWTLIERQSEGGEVLIRGWVFTRYLAKFKTRIPFSNTEPKRLGRVDIDEVSHQFDEEFLRAAEFVLQKNEELYRRLA